MPGVTASLVSMAAMAVQSGKTASLEETPFLANFNQGWEMSEAQALELAREVVDSEDQLD